MSDTNDKAKELMEKGWRTREKHNFEDAEKLLLEAKEMFEGEGDWFNVTECLNHLAYNEKVQAIKHLEKGTELANESLTTAQENKTKEVFAYRALLSLADAFGNPEAALKYANKTLETYDESADRADMLAHIASIKMRMGNLENAQNKMREAKEMFEKFKDSTSEPHKSIWETKLLGTQALIEFNSGNKEKAKELAQRARNIAKEKDLKTRLIQIQNVLDVVS